MYYWDKIFPYPSLFLKSFSSCQKNVLLGLSGTSSMLVQTARFQQLLEECTIGTNNLLQKLILPMVSVVVRRMYYWDSVVLTTVRSANLFQQLLEECTIGTALCNLQTVPAGYVFQQLLEECTIGTFTRYATFRHDFRVSVVVRRMYYWDLRRAGVLRNSVGFSSCQKNVLLGLSLIQSLIVDLPSFSSCQKNVLLGHAGRLGDSSLLSRFQQLLEECTIGTIADLVALLRPYCFSSCQKNVLLGRTWNLSSSHVTSLFQQLLEECTIGTSCPRLQNLLESFCFSSCQKNVLLGQLFKQHLTNGESFSSCQKNVLLGPVTGLHRRSTTVFQQLLEECTIGTLTGGELTGSVAVKFQQLLEECTIGTVLRRLRQECRLFQQLLEECTIGTYQAVKQC